MKKTPLEEQFPALLDEHKGILYKVCSAYCRNREDREDLAQEIVVQLWRSLGSFDAQYRFSTWMYRIALNAAISFCRRESIRVRYVLSDEAAVLQAPNLTPERGGEIDALYEFIGRMDPLGKALVLLYLDGHSYQEIAEVLGLSETNVATKINRLKQTMRQQLNRRTS